MSTWITPAGSIGTYTQSQPLTFDFTATASSGGIVIFSLANATKFPASNFKLSNTTELAGVWKATLTGTPNYVPVAKDYNFILSATEYVDGTPLANIRAFSMTVSTTEWVTTAGNIGTYPEDLPLDYTFEATPSQVGNTISYSQLNGKFPISNPVSPITLTTGGYLSGTPAQVANNTTSEFTLRATELFTDLSGITTVVGVADRTFNVTISGVTPPQFITPAGELFTKYDSTWVEFPIQYNNPDPNTVAIIDVVLGALPPGLEINSSGLIRGYAAPPTSSGFPIVDQTYTFTLQLASASGITRRQYSIKVNNQELGPSYIGRAPTMYNNQPPSFVIPNNDVYAPYYFDGNNIGVFAYDNNFIFKFIGHDFDGATINYQITGLSGPPLYLIVDTSTGWVSGTLPDDIGENVVVYDLSVTVFNAATPLGGLNVLASKQYDLTLTVVGNIDVNVDWITGEDLGIINNGETSVSSVLAESRQTGVDLSYQIIGNEIASNLKTIVSTGTDFFAFGDGGSIVQGDSAGEDWLSLPDVGNFAFTSAIYDSPNIVVVGYDSSNYPICISTIDGIIYTRYGVPGNYPLRHIVQNTSLYVAVGDTGTLLTFDTAAVFPPGPEWVVQISGVANDLSCIIFNGIQYVAVGADSTIITSTDAITWSTVSFPIPSKTFTSICYAGSTYVVVGDGVIGTSTDLITWTVDTTVAAACQAVAYNGSETIIVADSGVILVSTDDGVSWVSSLTNTYNNLTSLCYDSVTTLSWYATGDGGTILVSSDQGLHWSSPTLGQLPPNLIMNTYGNIVGRVAFENTTEIVEQGVTRDYTFRVQAYSTAFTEITSIKTFKLTTRQEFYLPYDNLYIKALIPLADRSLINTMIADPVVIPPAAVYRPEDVNFGKATSVIYQHMFGVPSIAVDQFYAEYIAAVTKNHYWRNITLGELKTAIARDANGDILYEVVYSSVIDDLVNSQGVSISKEVYWPRNINLQLNAGVTSNTDWYSSYTYSGVGLQVRTVLAGSSGTTIQLSSVDGLYEGMNLTGLNVTNNIDATPPIIVADSIDSVTNTIEVSISQSLTVGQQVILNPPLYTSLTPGEVSTLYPNSLYNMREQIAESSIGRINKAAVLPLWMRSQQRDGNVLGYTPAWVICYTKPEYGDIVKNNIQTYISEEWNNFNLNAINFQLDRFEVDRSLTYNYLGTLSGIPQWETLPSAQPFPIEGDNKNSYVYFLQKTILPNSQP